MICLRIRSTILLSATTMACGHTMAKAPAVAAR
jgi:hypothetical protein